MPLHNRRRQKRLRQRLRTYGTTAEAALWTRLQRRQLGGYKWRRQFGVGPYVLDFYCPQTRLAVELDGAVHDRPDQRAYDAKRTDALTAVGVTVLRFENRLVFERPDAVLATILDACGNPPAEPVGGAQPPSQ